MSLLKKIGLGAVFAIAATGAHATTITFEGPAANSTTSSYYDQGVTFTTTGGQDLIFREVPGGSQGILPVSTPYSAYRADFDSAYTGTVSVDLGDYNADSDVLHLELYDAADNLLASTSQAIASSFVGMVTLSISASNIAYAIFYGVGGNGNSVFADNFTYEGEIPIPAAAPLFLGALGLMRLVSGRRKKTA